MDSFFKSALLSIMLIILSLVVFELIKNVFPLLANKWYFALGIILGVIGVLVVQDRNSKYEEDEKRNGF